MKHFIVIALSIINYSSIYSQHYQYWDTDSTIKWLDFQGAVGGRNRFHVECGIELYFEDIINEEKWHLRTFFDKDKSWVNEELKQSKLALSAATCYFEITEIYKRRLEVEFHELDKKQESNINEYWRSYRKNSRELKRTLKRFQRNVKGDYTSDSYVNWREWIIGELWHPDPTEKN